MAVRKIIQPNNPVLRQKARPVTSFDDDFQQLVDDMIETMRAASGVGLAAPQIEVPLRVAVIETLPDTDDEGQEIEGTRDLYVVANPEIVWTAREMVDGIEGCLSLPGYLGEVARHKAIRVRAQDRHGNKIRLRLRDWDARIFQHEIDHLGGVLYIDRLTAPENFWTEEQYMEQFGASEDEVEDAVT